MGDKTNRPESTEEASALSAEVRTAVSRLYTRFRSERIDGELGAAAQAVLDRLRKQGPQSLKALSDDARVTPGSMSQTVNRLTEGGYAIRVSDPTDGRRVLFELTPEGMRYAKATLAPSISWLDAQIERLSAEERNTLSRAASLLLRIAGS